MKNIFKNVYFCKMNKTRFNTRQEATIAAIDNALEYLSNQKNKYDRNN